MLPCRLCTQASNDFKTIFDECGQESNIYTVIVRYFDPMLLNSSVMQDSKVICINCWDHINKFYTFEQSILAIQTKLQEDSKIVLPFIKTENEIRDEFKIELPDNEEENVEKNKPNLDYSSDDDKPLILLAKYNPTMRNLGRDSKRCKRKTGKSKCTRMAKKSIKLSKKSHDSGNKILENLKPEGVTRCDGSSEHPAFSTAKHNNNNKRLIKSQQYDEFISQWKQHFDCDQCNVSCSNLNQFRKHFKLKHPQTKFYIICCSRKHVGRCQMVEHIRWHIDPNAFKCDTCGKCTSSSRNLKKHIQERHTEEAQERRYECHVCQKRFALKGILKSHIDTHVTGDKDHVCKSCGKGFVLASRLRAHERTVHNVDHVCDQCGKTIHGKYALKNHLLEHAGIMKRKWACDQCSAELTSHSGLKRHKESFHHDGSTVYVCSECGKISPSRVALLKHKKYVHQAIRRHKCTICDKAFKMPTELKEHMAAHTGQDLYQCPHCPKTFKACSNMHHHRKGAHPIEWAEARQNRLQINKVATNLDSNKVIL